jgi:hypothetical protein
MQTGRSFTEQIEGVRQPAGMQGLSGLNGVWNGFTGDEPPRKARGTARPVSRGQLLERAALGKEIEEDSPCMFDHLL